MMKAYDTTITMCQAVAFSEFSQVLRMEVQQGLWVTLAERDPIRPRNMCRVGAGGMGDMCRQESCFIGKPTDAIPLEFNTLKLSQASCRKHLCPKVMRTANTKV